MIIEYLDVNKITTLLMRLNEILNNIKENEGNLRIDCSVEFYNKLTDEYNEIMKIKRHLLKVKNGNRNS